MTIHLAIEITNICCLPFSILVNLDDILQIETKDLKLDEEIGCGGFGRVYQATWLSTDDKVAVKKLHPTYLDKGAEQTFFNELKLLNRLHYDHIINFYGACLEAGSYALVMEYMSLGSLYKLLQKQDVKILWPDQVSIALQAAKGINYLHRYEPQILHRDIKSSNFLLERTHDEYLVKVCDFGLARIRSETTRQTKVNTKLACTLPWTAPEILSFKKHTDKSDIYSLGIVYWELATKEIPYGDCPDDVISRSVSDGKRLPTEDIKPSNFRTIIEKCWVHKPDDRPDSTRLIQMIKECSENQSKLHIYVF